MAQQEQSTKIQEQSTKIQILESDVANRRVEAVHKSNFWYPGKWDLPKVWVLVAEFSAQTNALFQCWIEGETAWIDSFFAITHQKAQEESDLTLEFLDSWDKLLKQ